MINFIRTQFRFVHNFEEATPTTLNWKPLEEESYEIIFRPNGVLETLYNESKSQSQYKFTSILLFCSEGYNIPESLQIADLTAQFLQWNQGKPHRYIYYLSLRRCVTRVSISRCPRP